MTRSLNPNRFLYNILLLLLLITWGVFGLCGCASSHKVDLWKQAHKRGYLTIGTSVTAAPYGFLDAHQQPHGFEIDINRELARRLMGNTKAIHFVYLTVPARLAALNTGKVDFILGGYTITEYRKKYVRFTQPHYTTFLHMLVRKNSGIQTLDDLVGKKVAFDFGGTSETILKTYFPQFNQVGYHTLAEELTALDQGRVDAVIHLEDIGNELIKKQPQFAMLPERLAVHQFGAGFVKQAHATMLFNKVQQTLNAMEVDGFINRTAQKWMHRNAAFPHPEDELAPMAQHAFGYKKGTYQPSR